MPSIQSALMSQSLPLSEAFAGGDSKPKTVGPDQEKAAKDFESVFTSMLLKEMRKTLEPTSLFGEDSSDIYGGLFDQFMGQHVADAGGIGIAKVVLESMKHLTAAPKNPTTLPVTKTATPSSVTKP